MTCRLHPLLVQATAARMPLEDGIVHCAITSPPYWGLRDYGLPPLVWGGGADCDHQWVDAGMLPKKVGNNMNVRGEQEDIDLFSRPKWEGTGNQRCAPAGQWCAQCGAWLGSLGLEPTPELYVEHLVEILREVRRVLRDDGVLWLNLGDTYTGSGRGRGDKGHAGQKQLSNAGSVHLAACPPIDDLKSKDLVGIPWRVAFALQADGWWLRSAIPWVKKSGMTESVGDRPTTAHEYWFLLTKSKHYYYDTDAVTKPAASVTAARGKRGRGDSHKHVGGAPGQTPHTMRQPRPNDPSRPVAATRRRRTSDTFFEGLDALIAEQHQYTARLECIRDEGGFLLDEGGGPLALVYSTRPYSGAHFATFNPDMVEPLILCSTSARGACPVCGGAWQRVVERRKAAVTCPRPISKSGNKDRNDTGRIYEETGPVTLGWIPTCHCQGAPGRGPVTCRKCGGTGGERKYEVAGGYSKGAGRRDPANPGGGLMNYVPPETGAPCPACDYHQLRDEVPQEVCDTIRGGSDPRPGRVSLFKKDDIPLEAAHYFEPAGCVEGDVWPDGIDDWPTVPCIVLDPFCGSGATGVAARRLGRAFMGIDYSFPYLAEQAAPRLGMDALREWEGGGVDGGDGKEPNLEGLPLFDAQVVQTNKEEAGG